MHAEYVFFVEQRDHEKDSFFSLWKDGNQLLRVRLKDLSASVAVVWNHEATRLAVTWSDGGAIGGFNVLTFAIEGSKVLELPATAKAYADFSQRHYCESRGDNTQAYGWTGHDHLMLVFSVYPTSDCGADSGHTEGYIVEAQTGEVLKHLPLPALEHFMKLHPL